MAIRAGPPSEAASAQEAQDSPARRRLVLLSLLIVLSLVLWRAGVLSDPYTPRRAHAPSRSDERAIGVVATARDLPDPGVVRRSSASDVASDMAAAQEAAIRQQPTFLQAWLASAPEHIAATGNRERDASNGQPACDDVAQSERDMWYRSRYVLVEAVKPGYGLTNQLIAYAGVLAYAAEDRSAPEGSRFAAAAPRRVILPPARIHAVALINFSRSTFPAASLVVTDPCEAAFVHGRTSKMRHLKAPLQKGGISRTLVSTDPQQALDAYRAVMKGDAGRRSVELWDMYLRWPFAAQTSAHSMAAFFCGLSFADGIRDAADTMMSDLGLHTNSFVSLHLRQEPQDAATMRRGTVSLEALDHFFGRTVEPFARKHGARIVVVHSAPLAASFVAALRHRGDGAKLRVVFKGDAASATNASLLNRLPTEQVALPLLHDAEPVRPTRAAHAAIDVLMMDKAAGVLLTAYSSLTALVTARRCCASYHVTPGATSEKDNRGGGGNVELYDVRPDNSLSNSVQHTCGVTLAPYLVASDMKVPAANEDVFRPNLDPSSPLQRGS